MIIVYDMRRRPQLLHDVRRRHAAEHVVARNPRYVRTARDIESGATLVYLTEPHAVIQDAYAAKDIDVIVGAELQKITDTTGEPLTHPEETYRIMHRGRGMFIVLDQDDHVLTPQPVNRAEAEEIREQANKQGQDTRHE